MSNESLASWKTDTAIILLGTLPLQTLDSANVLVEDYLSATGGWVPEDPGDPTGPGEPASGETSPQAAQSIADEQLERVYNIRTEASIKLNFHLVQNLDPGLSDNDVIILIEETVNNFIAEQLGCTNMELTEVTSFETDIQRGGTTTQDIRDMAQADIESGDKLIDPVAISLSLARERFDLDDNWNVSYIYNEPDQDIVAQVERYTDTTYATLDPFSVTQHIVTIDTVNYQLASGVSKSST